MPWKPPTPKSIPTKFTIRSVALALSISGNGKTGIAVDMEAIDTCPGRSKGCQDRKTNVDGKLSKRIKCYAMNGNYVYAQPLYKRNKEVLLAAKAAGMSDLAIAWSIVDAIMSTPGVKAIEWIRIHGSGDCWSVWYIKILILVAKLLRKHYDKGRYLYTRSAVIPTLLPALMELAKVADVNLSADYSNYHETANAYLMSNCFRRIACMQGDDPTWIFKMVEDYSIPKHKIIGFPEHSNGMKTKPMKGLPVCPSLLGVIKSDEEGAACQKCTAICHA